MTQTLSVSPKMKEKARGDGDQLMITSRQTRGDFSVMENDIGNFSLVNLTSIEDSFDICERSEVLPLGRMESMAQGVLAVVKQIGVLSLAVVTQCPEGEDSKEPSRCYDNNCNCLDKEVNICI